MSDHHLIDVRQRIAESSVEELCATADEYFSRLENWDYLLSKSLAQVNEAPELLQCFAHVVQGLELAPDMVVLDFGAGACWTSRFLSQMGVSVIALDVSESALRVGEELYRRLPPIGHQPAPRFMQFDGRRIALADESVDRITCWEAFHHVPNPADVLTEMARVLKPGGIAGFSEPGPTHSRSAQSQTEMRNHHVIENDVIVEDIWRDAVAAGFCDMHIAVFTPRPPLLRIDEFLRFTSGPDEIACRRLVDELRRYLPGRRLFFLSKAGVAQAIDSRRRDGLAARIRVDLTQGSVSDRLHVRAQIRNTGRSTWLGKSARVGAVHFGAHLYGHAGKLLSHGFHIHYGLGGDDPEAAIPPGGSREFEFEMQSPQAGDYVFEFDVVSSGITWFANCGTQPMRIAWRVREAPS